MKLFGKRQVNNVVTVEHSPTVVIRNGDRLLVELTGSPSLEGFHRIREQLRGAFPDNEVFVLVDGHVSVIEGTPSEENPNV